MIISELIKEIQPKFDRVLCYSQGLNSVNTEPFFELWAKNKESFYNAFGYNLIWESSEPVTFHLNEKMKREKVDELIQFVENDNIKLAEFIHEEADNFFKNETSKVYNLPDGKQIPKGMKLTRAFKFFEDNARLLDIYQTKASMILQEDKVTGILCLSIHPLDFLSTSENASGWRSCHSLDGEYRAGNLSYMVDSSTVVCYLKAEGEDTRLSNFPYDVPWNNKKWRTLLFFSNDQHLSVFAGRQYPFFSRGALDVITEALKKTIWENAARYHSEFSDWHDEFIKDFPFSGKDGKFSLPSPVISINRHLAPIENFMTEGSDLFYNDLLHSTCYKPYYSWVYSWEKPHFNIGGQVPCIHCGEDNCFTSGSMMCKDCERDYGYCEDEDFFIYCECCGQRIFVEEDNGAYLYTGEYYCEDCLARYAEHCDACGEWYRNDDMRYDREGDRMLCEGCYNYYAEREDVD